MKKYKCLFCDTEPVFNKSTISNHVKDEHKDKWEEYLKDKIHISKEVGIEIVEKEEPVQEKTEVNEQTSQELLDEIDKENIIDVIENIPVIEETQILEQGGKEMSLEKLKKVGNKIFGKKEEPSLENTQQELEDMQPPKQPVQEIRFHGIIADARHQKKLNDILTDFVVDNGITVKEFTWKTFIPEQPRKTDTELGKLETSNYNLY